MSEGTAIELNELNDFVNEKIAEEATKESKKVERVRLEIEVIKDFSVEIGAIEDIDRGRNNSGCYGIDAYYSWNTLNRAKKEEIIKNITEFTNKIKDLLD